MKVLSLLLLFALTSWAQKNDSYATFFEKGNGNQSADYTEVLRFYQQLDADFETMYNAGLVKLCAVRNFPAHQYLWPIPTKEILINPNLTQNPGY